MAKARNAIGLDVMVKIIGSMSEHPAYFPPTESNSQISDQIAEYLREHKFNYAFGKSEDGERVLKTVRVKGENYELNIHRTEDWVAVGLYPRLEDGQMPCSHWRPGAGVGDLLSRILFL